MLSVFFHAEITGLRTMPGLIRQLPTLPNGYTPLMRAETWFVCSP